MNINEFLQSIDIREDYLVQKDKEYNRFDKNTMMGQNKNDEQHKII